MTRSSSAGVSTPAAVLSVAAVAVAVAVSFMTSGNRTVTRLPADAPIATPVASLLPIPPAAPGRASPLNGAQVPLDTALGHDVAVVITDLDGLLVDARSGTGGDGMSVRWGTADVRNIDPYTLLVTWPGYPRDEVVGLLVHADGDGVQLRFGEDAPYPNTDAMGADRVIVLVFAEPVTASSVAVEFTAVDG